MKSITYKIITIIVIIIAHLGTNCDIDNNTGEDTEIKEKAATPEYSIKSGTHTTDIEIEITSATNGSTVHYTTNGHRPTNASTKYTTPIKVTAQNGAITIKAIAVKESMANSNIASASYKVIYPIVKNENHIIYYEATSDKINIILEALTDKTNKADRVSLYVDVNKDGKTTNTLTDPSDVAYTISSKHGTIICSYYIYSRYVSSPCGEFRTNAYKKFEFKSTINNEAKHPVWELTIPKEELTTDESSAHIAVNFYNDAYGHTSYPFSGENPEKYSKDFSEVIIIEWEE